MTGTGLRVPAHIVYRELARETAIFDLRSGEYHSLPRATGVVLSLIERHGSVDAAATELARRTGRSREASVACLAEHCRGLGHAGLLEPDRRPPGRPRAGQSSRAA